MQYVKLLSGIARIRDRISEISERFLDSVRRPYLGNQSDMDRASLLLTIATLGVFPSLVLLIFYSYHGVTAGILLFLPLILLLPLWYVLLRSRWPGIQITSHLFVLTTVISFQGTITFSNGLHSPFFAWQILSPLAAILLVNFRGLIFWGIISFLLINAWYFLDLPFTGDLIVGSEIVATSASHMMLYFIHLTSLWLLLRNRQQIFATQFQLESEMQKSQQVITGIVKGQLEERGRLYRELSGELGPMLAEIRKKQLQLVEDQAIPAGEASELQGALDAIEEELERISRDLESSELEENGLYAAILNLCSHLENTTQVRVHTNLPAGAAIAMDARSMHIYRIIQEALRNIARHAQARTVHLRLRLESQQIVAMHIEDDGIGIKAASAASSRPGRIGQGLQNIEDRVALLNGHLSIDAAASGGTRIRISLPDPIHKRLRLPFK